MYTWANSLHNSLKQNSLSMKLGTQYFSWLHVSLMFSIKIKLNKEYYDKLWQRIYSTLLKYYNFLLSIIPPL